jgi:hypothetical protein
MYGEGAASDSEGLDQLVSILWAPIISPCMRNPRLQREYLRLLEVHGLRDTLLPLDIPIQRGLFKL